MKLSKMIDLCSILLNEYGDIETSIYKDDYTSDYQREYLISEYKVEEQEENYIGDKPLPKRVLFE